MKRILGITLLIGALAFTGTSYAQNNKSRLNHKVQTAAADRSANDFKDYYEDLVSTMRPFLPMQISEGINLVGIQFSPSMRQLIYEVDMVGNGFDSATIQANASKPEVRTTVISSLTSDNTTKELLRKMIEDKVSFVYLYKFPKEPNKEVKMIIPPSEIDYIVNCATDVDKYDAARKMIQAEIDAASLPMDLGNGMVMVDMEVIDGAFAYYYDCEEPKINMDAIEAASGNIKNELSRTLVTASTLPFLNNIATCGFDILFIYVGKTSAKQVVIDISCDELKRMIKNYKP